MKGLTDIAGIRVGHASDYEGITGCTVILCESGAVAGVDVRGSASGTQELETLSPLHVATHVHAVVLAGGSAFGLEAASGVRRFLEAKGVGFDVGVTRVPIVPSAILFDLGIGKAGARPTREMGEAAAAAATDGPVKEGNVGAGTGATVGKIRGMKNAMKGGLGSFTVDLGAAVKVSALAAVNAFGDIRDPGAGKLVAGARDGSDLLDTARAMKQGARGGYDARQNTTLVVVATNARLTKPQAAKLAQFGQQGVVRTLSPAHTMSDGDTVFALSLGEAQANINTLGIAAAEAVAEAILRAVRAAETLGGVPGLASAP
ncbi:MAG: P1 family peptidase [Bryobacteraceae bacterium]|nr:P1 family peptidase [Bryobacteraceae bacterium]